jgi:hypothetical protein
MVRTMSLIHTVKAVATSITNVLTVGGITKAGDPRNIKEAGGIAEGWE